MVKTVLNLSQLDWAGFNQTVAESGQLVYNRPNRFTQKLDLQRQEGVCSSRASPCFARPLVKGGGSEEGGGTKRSGGSEGGGGAKEAG